MKDLENCFDHCLYYGEEKRKMSVFIGYGFRLGDIDAVKMEVELAQLIFLDF